MSDIEPCAEPDGWPEFTITLYFYVPSFDPSVTERERQEVYEVAVERLIEGPAA